METSGSGILRVLLLLSLGQLASLLLAITNFTSSLIADSGVNAPLTQSFFTYSLLALVCGTIFFLRRQTLLVPWYWYLLLAFVDVQGNYLVVKAYQYSSITSVTLLDCWTLPWVIILTRVVLGTQYSIWQFMGSVICVSGLALALVSDSSTSGGGERPLLGDFLVIAGTFFYALSNVGEEYCVKKKSSIEFLMMLGVCGMLVGLCEISLFERKALELIQPSPTTIVLFTGFAAASFLFCLVSPLTLKTGGAALFNLSLLTSDMWAVVIRVFIYHQKVDWLYYVAFTVVAGGLIMYSLSEKKPPATTNLLEEEDNMENAFQYEPVCQESPVSIRGQE